MNMQHVSQFSISKGVATLILKDGSAKTKTFSGRASQNRAKKCFRQPVFSPVKVVHGIECAKYYLSNLSLGKTLIETDSGYIRAKDIVAANVEVGESETIDVELTHWKWYTE